MKVNRKIKRLLIITLICILTVTMGLQLVNANAVDKLTIKIGYFGWKTSDYVEKAVFKASELYDMGTVREDYTYWDGGKRVAIDSSLGVPLTRIIDAAGVDKGSISQMDFWTADSGSGAFTSFTWQQLIGTKRYYFRDLAACFEYEKKYDASGNPIEVDNPKIILNEEKAWGKAQKVNPMMALEETWVWYQLGDREASGTDKLTTANRFRLNFGQAAPNEKRTFNSAKQVHTIYIMFSGSPKLSSKETNINGKVGSNHQLKVSAAAADEDIEKKMEGSVVWSSSNSDIVSVDENGKLTFNKNGTATIYAKSGGAVKEFKITVGDQNGEGGGSGGNGKGKGTNPDAKGEGSKTESKKVTLKNGLQVYELSDEAANRLRLAISKQAKAEEASMNTHQEEMDDDAEQLTVKKETNRLGFALVGLNMSLAMGGVSFGLLRYKKQRWG